MHERHHRIAIAQSPCHVASICAEVAAVAGRICCLSLASLSSSAPASPLRCSANPRAATCARSPQLQQRSSAAQRAELKAARRGLAARTQCAGRPRWAQLQAQANRLNALGERLTQVGKLNDGEFDFDQRPGIGGAEEPATGVTMPLPLQSGIDSLRAEFDRQQAQLDRCSNPCCATARSTTPLHADRHAGGPGLHHLRFRRPRRSVRRRPGASTWASISSAGWATRCIAVADGVVSFAGVRSGYGNVVEIDHGNGYITRYAHNSRVGRRRSAIARARRPGASRRSARPVVRPARTCHFEVWCNGRAGQSAGLRSRAATRANRCASIDRVPSRWLDPGGLRRGPIPAPEWARQHTGCVEAAPYHQRPAACAHAFTGNAGHAARFAGAVACCAASVLIQRSPIEDRPCSTAC